VFEGVVCALPIYGLCGFDGRLLVLLAPGSRYQAYYPLQQCDTGHDAKWDCYRVFLDEVQCGWVYLDFVHGFSFYFGSILPAHRAGKKLISRLWFFGAC
jgi:hypothetical protein